MYAELIQWWYRSVWPVSNSRLFIQGIYSYGHSCDYHVRLVDFDLTVSIVHPMGGLQLVFFGYLSDRGIRKGRSCSSTLLRYYGTANYMLPLETHIKQGYPLWFVAISGHINTQINSNRVNYTGILECIVNHSKNLLISLATVAKQRVCLDNWQPCKPVS